MESFKHKLKGLALLHSNYRVQTPSSCLITDEQVHTYSKLQFPSPQTTTALECWVKVSSILMQLSGCNRCSPAADQTFKVGMMLLSNSRKSKPPGEVFPQNRLSWEVSNTPGLILHPAWLEPRDSSAWSSARDQHGRNNLHSPCVFRWLNSKK